MGRHRLIPHPATPAAAITSVEVELSMTDHDDMLIRYSVEGGEALSLPDVASPRRTDELWKTTCFEMFLKPDGAAGYFEFNFSPSTRWAAYAFDGYRDGMRDLPLSVDPHVETERQGDHFALEADLDLADLPADRMRMSLSAVIEESDGTKSYWAAAHPPEKPDFHDDACFILELPAARAP